MAQEPDRWFAHSLPDRPPEEWEPLVDHLTAVGCRAGRFAETFGARDWARAAGLLHDVGKITAAFQAYLRGTGGRVDHSSAGAAEARRRYGPTIGDALGFCIAGHHAGLPDKSGDASLDVRLSLQQFPKDYGAWETAVVVPESLVPPPTMPIRYPHLSRIERGFADSFFIRMLFSCLVDADFLETERFLDRNRSAERGGFPSLSALKTRFDRHLGDLQTKARIRADTPINRHRADILAQCRRAAAQPPGVFSLTVPTGGGKTLSSLAFALDHAQRHGKRRVVYVIPYTSIIEQTAAVVRDALGPDLGHAVLEHHSAFDPAATRPAEEPIGPDKMVLATENWDAPIVVTTAVQFLESLFASRPSRCRKLHNLTNSVIILDEAQALPSHRLKPSVAALAELAEGYGATLVLCTATQPALGRSPALGTGFRPGTVREIIPDPDALYAAFRRVRVEDAGDLTDADLAARLEALPQALCITETRAHAQALFAALGDAPDRFHLSAAMCPAHRRQVLDAVRQRLKDDAPCRLIATTVVEAGVDIDFPVVFRALAGVDAIAQAAGRCNREGKRSQPGRLVLYRTETQNRSPDLARRRAATASLMQAPDNAGQPDRLLDRDTIGTYFHNLLTIDQGAGLDKDDSHRRLAESKEFRSVAATFHVIDDAAVSLLVPHDDKAQKVIADLRDLMRAPAVTPRRLPLALLRQAQQFAVSVSPYQLKALEETCALDWLDRAERTRFPVLCLKHLYDPQVGLMARVEGGEAVMA